jgi:hypothetical protein
MRLLKKIGSPSWPGNARTCRLVDFSVPTENVPARNNALAGVKTVLKQFTNILV